MERGLALVAEDEWPWGLAQRAWWPAPRLPLSIAFHLGPGVIGVCAAYARIVAARTKPGAARVLALLPALILPQVVHYLCIDARFHSAAFASLSVLAYAWIAPMKFYLLGLNRGPLANPELSAVQFALLAVLPITGRPSRGPESRGQGESGKRGSANLSDQLRLGTYKLALLVVVVVLLTLMEDGSLLKDLLYALGLYALLGLVLDVGGSIGMAMVGLECDPHFDHPFLVTSTGDFWRRWDLVVGRLIRQCAYDPIIEGSLVKPSTPPSEPKLWSRVLGAHAAFLLSGVMHEYIWLLAAFTPGALSPGLGWLVYFLIQAPIMTAERTVGKFLVHRFRIRLPRAAITSLALLWCATVGHLTFLRAARAGGVSQRVAQDMRDAWHALRGTI